MSRLTSVGSRRVLERVIVVKSEKRTLIEIVRPTMPAARTRAAVRSLSLSSSRRMYAGSSTSKENDPGRRAIAELEQLSADVCRVVHVEGERLVGADAALSTSGHHRARVASPGQRVQGGPCVVAQGPA